MGHEPMLAGTVRAEFTIFPFEEGDDMPPYVQAGLDAISALGVAVEIGPLSNTIHGTTTEVTEALRAAESASFAAGATRIVVNLEAAHDR
jgi:uncharacterized protein YqgV (UPF0045/DUF77 family)